VVRSSFALVGPGVEIEREWILLVARCSVFVFVFELEVRSTREDDGDRGFSAAPKFRGWWQP